MVVSEPIAEAVAARLQQVFAIYTTKNTKELINILDTYASKQAEFADNLVAVRGLDDYKLQFYMVQRLFEKVQIDVRSVDVATQDDGVVKVVVRNQQIYSLPSSNSALVNKLPAFVRARFPGSASLDVKSTLWLTPGDLKVLKHHDVWQHWWAVPTPQFCRRLGAIAMNKALRAAGYEQQLYKDAGLLHAE